MSTSSVRIQIGDANGSRFEEVEAVVDTGATFTAAPQELLERLGVRRDRRQRFHIANGQVTENGVGDARVRVQALEAITPVIFNEPGEPVLLGAVTLEVLLLGVDPAGQRLFPVEGLRVSCYDL